MRALPAYSPETFEESGLRVKTYTFGCKVNRADSISIESELARHENVSIVRNGAASPDVVIVNTCTVTSSADRQARQLLRRLHREHPEARIIVTGCYAEAEPDTLSKIGGVDSVVPIRQQEGIPALLGLNRASLKAAGETAQFGGRTRAYLKLQDGCNAYCSFCVLPFIRGRSRSVPLEGIVRQAGEFARAGFREIVVTGTHIGGYGRDLAPRIKLSDVLRAIACELPDTAIRVSSLEPAALTPDLIRAVRDLPRIRPHFHIPLQSGSDRILKGMNRKYRVEKYAERVEALARTRGSVGLGADVIVGFPGETDEDFGMTRRWVEKLPITFLHVFRFSARPGTRAAEMADTVPESVKHSRMKELMELGRRKAQAFHGGFVGSVQPVLVEKKRDGEGRLTGYTPHYVSVRMAGPDRFMEREIDVRLLRSEGDSVIGEVV